MSERADAQGRTWPPGPPAGVMGWDILKLRKRDILGAVATWKAEYGDIVHLRIWPEHEVIVANPELVRKLLVENHDGLLRWERAKKINAQLLGQSVFVVDGAPWKAKRTVMQASYSLKVVQQGVPELVSTINESLQSWPDEHGDWPIEARLTTLTMDMILRSMFSHDFAGGAQDVERALRDMQRGVHMQWAWVVRLSSAMPWNRRKREARERFRNLIDKQIDLRLAKPLAEWPEDVLTRLLRLHHEDPRSWPLKAVSDECITAFLAGYDTVASTLSWWCWAMATHPQLQESARANVREHLGDRLPRAEDLASLDFLKQTLLETLRLYPAAPVLNIRRSIAAIELGSWKIPRRARFVIPVVALHHDARWFPEPGQFRPERFAEDAPEIPRGAFLPFGVGPRVCLGQHQAMTELVCVAAMLLQRYELHQVEGRAAPVPVYRAALRPNPPVNLRIASVASASAE